MNKKKIFKIVSVFSLVVIVVMINISLSSSLSVGGIIYSSDSETCASCHIEVTYVKSYKNAVHGEENNVTCISCHQYSSPITDESCLTCHEDYADSNSTKFNWDWVSYLVIVDSHDDGSHISGKCTTCHIEHKFEFGVPKAVTKSLCRSCHVPIPPGVDISKMLPAP